MDELVADRLRDVPKSFIREILKFAVSPDIISFAGGLPNPKLFPVDEIKEVCCKVLEKHGGTILQYGLTEGYPPLREYLSDMLFKKYKIRYPVKNILITNGSQQGIDLIAKSFLDKNDELIIEKPGYVGAVQAFSVYQPAWVPIELEEDGININELQKAYTDKTPKMYYAVTNFQNPSGVTYSLEKRKKIAEILKDRKTLMIEDNPYEELRFMGEELPPMKSFMDNVITLGSFSKIFVPSFRLGWLCADDSKMDRLIVAKQATDLHTNYFAQCVVFHYMTEYDIDSHLRKIKAAYKIQRDAMVKAMEKYFPPEIKYTKPEGGMFIWVTLPEHISSMQLFEAAVKENVAFVPGSPFYIDGGGYNTMRVNYSNSDPEQISEGIKRIAEAYKALANAK